MTIKKTWSGEKEDDVDVWVTKDGQKWYKVTMTDGEDGSQTGSAHIALGTITEHDGKVEVLTPGHEFTFAEDGKNAYHWEIKAETVRPMLINGVPTVLVLVDKAPTDGTKYYTIDGKYYVVKNLVDGELIIEATNEQRSNLDIVKVVTGNAPATDTFEFTIQVTSARSLNPDDKTISDT